MRDACFAGNFAGGGFIVSGQHVDFDAGGAQLADGTDGSFLYPVRDSGYCQCVFSVGKPDDGLCFHCQPGGLFLKGLTDGNPVLFQQFPVSGEVGPALCLSFHAFSGDAFKVLNVYGGGLLEVVHHGICQRMFRELFQTIENIRQRIARSGVSIGRHCLRVPYQLADYRFPFGHCSGLVEHHGVYLFGNLQAFGIFYQNAPFGSLADAYHDGGRSSQSQCTRAGDDDHRDKCQQSVGESAGFVQQHPCDEGKHCDAYDGRHEYPGYLVHQLLHRCLASLRVLHHVYNLCQQCIRADLLCPEAETTLLVDGPCKDLGVFVLGHCYRFTAQHAFVHVGGTFRHDAVHGNPFSGFHLYDVAEANLLNRDNALKGRVRDSVSFIYNDGRSLGLEPHQFLDGG